MAVVCSHSSLLWKALIPLEPSSYWESLPPSHASGEGVCVCRGAGGCYSPALHLIDSVISAHHMVKHSSYGHWKSPQAKSK
jgi:hypothetical protein